MNTSLPGWPLDSSPWHPGEQLAQTHAGVRERMEAVGRRAVRGEMPEQHRAFFPLLPQLFVATVDAEGQAWASALFGQPGFVLSPDPRTLAITLRDIGDDPVVPHLQAGSELGVLGLQLETRRRNRANGRLMEASGSRLLMQVRQSFGNCPKYIQTRRRLPSEARSHVPAGAGASLTDALKAFVARSDTFFIASSAGPAAEHETGGVDISHRGGLPGFAHWEGDALVWPEYQGNNFFNTLGNLLSEPRAGLLFIDWCSGDMLHLAGRTQVAWTPSAATAPAGPAPLRQVRFTPERWILRPGASPWRWTFDTYAPELQTDRTSTA